jgi:hypothetical protein
MAWQLLRALRSNDASSNTEGLTVVQAAAQSRNQGSPIEAPIGDIDRCVRDLKARDLVRCYRPDNYVSDRPPGSRTARRYRLTTTGYNLVRAQTNG